MKKLKKGQVKRFKKNKSMPPVAKKAFKPGNIAKKSPNLSGMSLR